MAPPISDFPNRLDRSEFGGRRSSLGVGRIDPAEFDDMEKRDGSDDFQKEKERFN